MTEIDLISWDDTEDAVIPSLTQAGLSFSLSLASNPILPSPDSPASTVPSPSLAHSPAAHLGPSTPPSLAFPIASLSSVSAEKQTPPTPPEVTDKITESNVLPSVTPDPYLTPRRYQVELFKKAQQGNVIAVMDTGSGKTLVAVMLIKEMIRREKDSLRILTERKICFFVVNNVPLVFQQASVIRANCDGTVFELCGAMQTDKFNVDMWKEIFAKADVVVLTAQILLDLFRHGFVKIGMVHLLIFDECHHARKDHPSCCIMREFYHSVPAGERIEKPKIFGMTASPSSDIGSKLFHSAGELERVLDSKVFTIDQDQIREYVERPLELVIQYNKAPLYPTTALTQRLRNDCSLVTKLASTFESVGVNLEHLGPWCVDRLWKIFVENLATNVGLKPLDEGSQIAIDIVKSWMFSPPICSPVLMTPKVLKLIQVLRASERSLSDDFCGIIFVQRRDTAVALCLLLQEFQEFKDVFRVQVLAGHGDESESVLRMSFREQNTIIGNFRNKVYNLLVSTSVAEEGLDIQPCNVVIRFDPVSSTISYIQSRGRARKKNSRYIMMHEYENRSEEALLEKIQYGEKVMKEWCQSLDEERLMQNPIDVDEDSAPDQLIPVQTYRVPSTGALLTMDSAIALLHYYCSTLSGDEFCSMKPEFNVTTHGTSGFVCDLTLPPNAPIRLLQSDHTSTKSMARKSAAFKTCERLHALGALNDNLLPIMAHEGNDDEVEESHSVDKSDKNKEYPLVVPVLWTEQPPGTQPRASISLFGCMVKLAQEDLDRLGGENRYRSMCLLTRQTLPCTVAPFYLYIDGSPRLVTLESHPVPMMVDQDRLEMLRKFTLSLFQRITRKNFECALENIPYFIAPLCRGYRLNRDLERGVAWDDVQLGQSLEPQEFQGNCKDESSLIRSVVTLRYDRGREFFIKRSLTEFKVRDQMPESTYRHEIATLKELNAKERALATKGNDKDKDDSARLENGFVPVDDNDTTFGAYFRAKFHADCPEDDVILLVERVRKMRNNLQPAVRDEEKNEDVAGTIIPLSVCVQCSIQSDILRMSQLIPSVLFSLDSTLLAHDVRESVGLQETRLDLLQVAFTSSSANRDHHYERLELLGDSFLKFSSTIRLYIVNPAKDEGQLHGARIRIISNKALLGHATSLQLYKYVSSTPFHRKSWRPTRFIVGGKPWEEMQHHRLSNKTLADIIEASLGAAYLSGGTRVALKAAKALGIPFHEFSDWDDFHKVHSQARLAKDQTEGQSLTTFSLTPTQLSRISEVQKILGYTFKDPRLFLEAMTHASHIRPDATCYQRLEFLGDAVLDFQVIRYYYSKYEDAPPGAITLIKDASVNNAILGAISIEWGLQKYLEHYSPTLISAIARVIVALEIKKEQGGDKLEGEYWTEISMPKVLGDLVESTLGAVFVDSGFDFEVVTDLFTRLIRPFLDDHVDFESIVIHPTKALVESLQSKGCQKFGFESDMKAPPNSTLKILRKLARGGPESGEPVLKCHFKIHDQIMYTATREGDNIEELRKEAAVATLALLKEDPELLSRLCTCPKKRGTRHMTMLDRYRQ